ncbi:glycosyltransferase [filamentous cyanobacterium LEGE 11480]|uniref:Glycosyltransferase n=1 Tax=Romeriopsis navalis LEGE 11480 TaxID=2777977 RepID=A0A928VHA8_9CYAN|nr:glycosyltransferase [Romeriopsis navalis]MBE9028320.1 glycosyltransferase [Romeriopsis navalis LEGE 11480]
MKKLLNWAICAIISLSGLIGLYHLQNLQLSEATSFGLINLGIISIWRWSLFFIRLLRSWYYQLVVFPRWRKRSHQVEPEKLPHICFVVPTYKEQPWITERVFTAIVAEAKTLPQPITVLVSSSGEAENATIANLVAQHDPEAEFVQLILRTQQHGKRKAMADSLRELSSLDLPSNTTVVLMDGDSELAPGTLRKCLPLFELFPQVGAVTTDELPIVEGSRTFSEWFHLRFAQRHHQMCSDSLARKVMCLTGRFSIFRGAVAFNPSFADQLEFDQLNDWLWGNFKFLSGDDKSTWFWLLQRRYEMIYVPDALVYSIESVSGSVSDRAIANMRRWFGNMLRNNSRALALGPNTTGWGIWYALLDQRMTIWTSLITPSLLLLALIAGNWLTAGIIVAWICFSRPIMLMLLFLGRISKLKMIHFPILLLTQWVSGALKVQVQMNLVQQKWSNRGNQSVTVTGSARKRVTKHSLASFLVVSQIFSFILVMLCFAGIINPWQELTEVNFTQSIPQATPTVPSTVINASAYGVVPNDGQDDSAAIQQLLRQIAPNQQTQVVLPAGALSCQQPITLEHNNLTLKGQGIDRTVLTQTSGQPCILIQPEPHKSQRVQAVSLENLTIQTHSQPIATPVIQINQADETRIHQVKVITHQPAKSLDQPHKPIQIAASETPMMTFVAIESSSNPTVPIETLPATPSDEQARFQESPAALTLSLQE